MTIFSEEGVRVETHDSGVWLVAPIQVDMNRDERERMGGGAKETVNGEMMLPLERIQICELYGYYDAQDNRGEVTVMTYVPVIGDDTITNKLDVSLEVVISALDNAHAFAEQLAGMRGRS